MYIQNLFRHPDSVRPSSQTESVCLQNCRSMNIKNASNSWVLVLQKNVHIFSRGSNKWQRKNIREKQAAIHRFSLLSVTVFIGRTRADYPLQHNKQPTDQSVDQIRSGQQGDAHLDELTPDLKCGQSNEASLRTAYDAATQGLLNNKLKSPTNNNRPGIENINFR